MSFYKIESIKDNCGTSLQLNIIDAELGLRGTSSKNFKRGAAFSGLKIAMIARGIYPYSIGGAEIHSYYVARELSKNHEVIILTQMDRWNISKTFVTEKINHIL